MSKLSNDLHALDDFMTCLYALVKTADNCPEWVQIVGKENPDEVRADLLKVIAYFPKEWREALELKVAIVENLISQDKDKMNAAIAYVIEIGNAIDAMFKHWLPEKEMSYGKSILTPDLPSVKEGDDDLAGRDGAVRTEGDNQP